MLQGLLAWLLLPLGLALGWALSRARRGGAASPAAAPAGVAADGALADDGMAWMIEAVGRAAAAEPGALELQLTLGAMFRRRGEVERAIQMHEALLAAAAQNPKDAAAVRLELAQDYLRAGLLDRAESLLRELDAGTVQAAAALELLVEIQEQSRDWPQAIETARRLQAAKGSSLAGRIAHYWCEQAEAVRPADPVAAAGMLETALEIDPDCVRASILQGGGLEAAQDWRGAIKAYWRSMQQDGRFFAEVAPAMARCCSAVNDPAAYAEFLAEAEAALRDSPAPALAKARWLLQQGQPVRDYLGAALARCPTREGLLLWVRGAGGAEAAPASLDAFAAALERSLKARPRYACGRCGLQPSVLFWQCPKCRTWGSVAPMDERL